MELPREFTERMKTMLGDGYREFISCYDLPAVRGLRVNTLKISKERFAALSPWALVQSETLDEGFILTEEAEHIGAHPYHTAGLFYMQEPSAMSVIKEAQIEPGMKVLDLCAAPGGKSGGAAARLKGEGLLVSNEIVPNRAKQLARNLERLGVVNAIVTCAHPDAFAENLPGFFDRVIVDAPCSGEGMFRKDPAAIAEWSPEHVASCASRQKLILESASRCVAPGGKLVYSTCTFSPEENEGVIEAFLAEHDDFALELMRRLYPHQITGEGHFVARLIRSGAAFCVREGRGAKRAAAVKSAPAVRDLNAAQQGTASAFFESTLTAFPRNSALRVNGNRLLYCPFEYPDALLKLPLVSFGAEVGEFAGSRLKPSHAFFMAAHGLSYRVSFDYPAESAGLRAFLGGNTLPAKDAPNGVFAPVTADGFPVGFGKIADGILKNHLPKGLVIAAYR